MKKYNLTFWQRVGLIPLWFIWIGRPKELRKSWHEVKKGMEKHEHKYTVYNPHNGYDYFDCEHEGCNFTSMSKTIG